MRLCSDLYGRGAAAAALNEMAGMSMSVYSGHFSGSPASLRADLSERWRGLCSRYLPLTIDHSIWRFSRAASPADLEQGWKLHVSATVLTACAVLEKIAPALRRRGVQFKAPTSLLEVHRINSGVHYGYSQVGKLFTIYPRSDEEAVSLSKHLSDLTRHMLAPSVPFDRRFSPDGCVYYRYGAFKHLTLENPDGTQTPAIHDPEGRLVPDSRDGPTAMPDWVVNPFDEQPLHGGDVPRESPLKTTYRAFRALTQRGRGGVYEALDLSVNPPRLCILKEGRRAGEVGWDGRDGSWRVRHEGVVTTALRATGVDAPQIYSSFTVSGNYYLVAELIDGETLQDFLSKRRKRLPVARCLRIGAELALLLSRIHDAGWTWRDCKPGNIVMTKAGRLRPLDFEGACPTDRPDPMPWGTQGFTPPEWRPGVKSRVYEDLYALGAMLYLLLTGRVPETPSPPLVARLRRHVPPEARLLIADLLSADPHRQPRARVAARRLYAAAQTPGYPAAEASRVAEPGGD